MPSIKELGLDRLTADERRALARELTDSVPEPDLTPGQAADLARRLAEHDADPAAGEPWPAVEARLRGRP